MLRGNIDRFGTFAPAGQVPHLFVGAVAPRSGKGLVVEIRDYLRTLRNRWRIVAVATVLGVLAALAVSLLTTPQYKASSQLFVTTTGSGDSVTGAYQGNLFSQQRVVSYKQLLTGDQVSRRVIDQLKLDTTPAALSAKISSTSVTDSVILAVSVTDPSPVQARDLTNAVATTFTGLVAELETPAGGGPPAARVTVVAPATTPTAPVVPQTTRNLLLGLLAGLLVGAGLAVLREQLDTSVRSRERAAEASGSAVIGAVPFDKDRPAHPLVDFASGRSTSAEAFRQIRTNLQFLDVDSPPRVLTITSTLPGEGKTTTAINLAYALAESGHRVVLMEADLRRPRVSKYLEMVGSVGLTTVLAGQADLDDVLQATANPNLQVLAAGKHPPKPTELLESEHMRTLLNELRGRTDYVVLDAPPLLPVTDSAVLGTITDGAVVVVRHGAIKRDQLARAAADLRAVDAPLLGVIMNMTPGKGSDDYEYYYYESDAPASDEDTLAPDQSGAVASGEYREPANGYPWEQDASNGAERRPSPEPRSREPRSSDVRSHGATAWDSGRDAPAEPVAYAERGVGAERGAGSERGVGAERGAAGERGTWVEHRHDGGTPSS